MLKFIIGRIRLLLMNQTEYISYLRAKGVK